MAPGLEAALRGRHSAVLGGGRERGGTEELEEFVHGCVCVCVCGVCVCVSCSKRWQTGMGTPQPPLIRRVLKLINYFVSGQNDLTRFQMSQRREASLGPSIDCI
jgi:hypothetical protein